MMGDNYMLDIRSRQIDVREIDKVKVQVNANYYKTMNLLVPISLIIFLGLLMNYRRKRKYTTN